MICRSLSHTFHSTHYITKKYPKGILKVSTFGINKNLLPSFPYTRQSPHDTEFTQKEMKPQPFVPGIFPSFIIFIIFQTGFQINFFIFTRGSGRGFRGGGRRWRFSPPNLPVFLLPNRQIRPVQNQLSSGPSLCRKVLLHLSGHIFS